MVLKKKKCRYSNVVYFRQKSNVPNLLGLKSKGAVKVVVIVMVAVVVLLVILTVVVVV